MHALLLATALASSPWERGLDVETQHLQILSTWAVGNLAVGTVAALHAQDPRWRAFHGTNAAWNTVNLGIGAAGLLGVRTRRQQVAPAPEAVARQHRGLRTALVVNLGLDGLYVGTGAALMAAGGETAGVDHRGMGASLLLQGAFLATFDATFLLAHRGIDAPGVAMGPTLTPVGDTVAFGLTWGRRCGAAPPWDGGVAPPAGTPRGAR